MTTTLLLATRLKVADPTAITALATLRTRLDCDDLLAGLSREELFLFEVEGRAAPARAAVEDLVRSTNLFLNPNKHRHHLSAAGSGEGPAPGPVGVGELPGRVGADEAPGPRPFLLVWTEGDGEDLREALARHGLAAGVAALRRAWLWSFLPRPGIAAAELIARIDQDAGRRGSPRRFLAHPAWQESRLYARRPGVYDVREALLHPVGGGVPDIA